MSPSIAGARSSSPGPVKVDWDMPPPIYFFTLKCMAPLSVIDGDIAIMAPGLADMGQPAASCRVRIELVSRWDILNAPPLNVPTSSDVLFVD